MRAVSCTLASALMGRLSPPLLQTRASSSGRCFEKKGGAGAVGLAGGRKEEGKIMARTIR